MGLGDLFCLGCAKEAADAAPAAMAVPAPARNARTSSAISLESLEIRPYADAANRISRAHPATFAGAAGARRASSAYGDNVVQLRRLSTAPRNGDGAALQRLCDLLRSKTGAAFVCIDVFGAQRPCSCTLAASGCAEDCLPLAESRLHTSAEAAEVRVLLPPSLALGADASMAALGASVGPGSGRRSIGASPLLQQSPMSGYAAGPLSTGAVSTACPPAPLSPQHARSSLPHGCYDRWPAQPVYTPTSAADGRLSVPTAVLADRPTPACAYERPSPASTIGSSPRNVLMSPRSSAPTCSSGLLTSGGGALSTGGGGGTSHGGGACFAPTLDPLPRHIRGLTEQFEPLVRSVWALPLLAASSNAGVRCSSPTRVANGGADGIGRGTACGDERTVLGILYLMGLDEQLFGAPRETLQQFCYWLSDAIVEGQLRLLSDMVDSMAHAAGPEAAVAAAATHLSDFFTHRTQGMSEVLAYPAFLQRGSGRAVLMLPAAAAHSALGLEAGGTDSIPIGASDCDTAAVEDDVLLSMNGTAADPDGAEGVPAAAADAPHSGGLDATHLFGSLHSLDGVGGAPPLLPFSVNLQHTLLYQAQLTGSSRGQAPSGPPAASSRRNSTGTGMQLPCFAPGSAPAASRMQQLPTPTAHRRTSGGYMGCEAGGGGSARSGTAHARCCTDVRLLPGHPQFVLVGVVRESSVQPVGSPAASPPRSAQPPFTSAIYLSFSALPRGDLAREMTALLDVLCVLLSTCFARLHAVDMLPQLEALLSQAHCVD